MSNRYVSLPEATRVRFTGKYGTIGSHLHLEEWPQSAHGKAGKLQGNVPRSRQGRLSWKPRCSCYSQQRPTLDMIKKKMEMLKIFSEL